MNFGDPRLPERVWSKMVPDATTSCWLWTGCNAGHPQIRWKVDGVWKVLNVRKLLASTLGISIAADHGIGSDCQVCCNPAHYRYGTTIELAVQWSSEHVKTHCVHGHDLSVEGYYVRELVGRGDVRRCRVCHAHAVRKVVEKRNRRRVARMKPERRELFFKRSDRIRELWFSGKIRRRDGSVTALAPGV